MFLTHAWDPDVPIAETAGVLDELRADGKIGAYGLSNVDGAQLRAALAAGGFGWVQNSYSLLDREAEAGGAAALRRARPRLHAVQPARRRLAHRQVPPRRGRRRRARG